MGIKSSAAGFAEIAGGDQFLEQRGRPVAVVAGLPAQNLQHRENLNETDLIRPAQGALGIVHAQAHGDVYLLGAGDAFFQAARCFVND
jgi:hypothetical protein